ncbi:hypothetical protein SAY87_006615 [Trapa incisa]|uniref:Histidine-containing phosphotransfer protein n=2 Tax=Trapa TaxID=22665 RepID=A0AAN7KY31_TRANT|nr:hypothetical protein SAY87_006615 [Trapa incisa]KAK4775211.1 hypothetical protein SAY86_010146 [Trapa natans]
MSRFHGNTQPPAGSVLEQLLAKYVDYMDSLRRESFLDDQFTQLLKLQDENNPDFVGEVVSLFFQDSERLIGNMGTALGKKSVDYKQVDADVHQLKGSSSSIGAVRIKNVCVFFRNLCEAKNLEGCYRCLHEVTQECVVLKNKLNTLFMLQKQIVAAGGSIPVD